MMGDAEIDELAADIKVNGLQDAIEYWIDDLKDPNAGPELLDGRGRLAALKRLGITDPRNAPYRFRREASCSLFKSQRKPGNQPLDIRSLEERLPAAPER